MGLSHIEMDEALERLRLEVDELRAARQRAALAVTPSVGVSSASSMTARSSTSSLSRSTSSSRASSSSAIPVPPSSSSTTGSSPPARPRGDRASRPADLSTAPRGGRPRRRIACRRDGDRHADRDQRVECAALARDCRSCVLLLARCFDEHERRWTGDVAVSADDGAARSSRRSQRRSPMTCLHGCAIASRRSAAG